MKIYAVLVLALVFACNSDKGDKSASGSGGGKAGAGKTSAGGSGASGGKGKKYRRMGGMIGEEEGTEMCARLIPESVRGGASVKGGGMDELLSCSLNRGKDNAALVTVDCARGHTVDELKSKPKQQEGLGRAAHDTSMGVAFLATNVDCVVTAYSGDSSIDQLALAKAVDGVVTAQTAPMPQDAAGDSRPGLRCDDVTPSALRDRLGMTERQEQTVSSGKLTCHYTGNNRQMWVRIACSKDPKKELDRRRKAQKRLDRFVRDVDVGSDGFEESGSQINFIDPQTQCVADFALLSPDHPDLLGIAKDIEAAITEDTIK